MAKLTFLGAARTVTGSKTLLELGSDRVLVDCGMFQGLKKLRKKNWEKFEYDPASIGQLILTHAHIDHSGYLPRLVKLGFAGPVYCTPPSTDLVELLLRDSARIQEEDAKWLAKKKLSKHKPPLPLYDSNDAEAALDLLRPVPYGKWFAVTEKIRARFTDIGHIIGSAMVDLEYEEDGKRRRILFSGDIGRYDMPLNEDPTPPETADIIVMESTYGNRNHPAEPPLVSFRPLVEKMIENRAVLVVPAFAVGRAQQIIYLAREMIQTDQVPAFPIYLDSPMAVDATRIYCKYPDNHTVENEALLGSECVLYGPNVHLVRSVEGSKKLNEVKGPALLISSSGMLSGGRILHHLKRRLPDPRCILALVGYQAVGTRGRALQQGAETIRIHGEDIPVRAEIADLGSMSGHADHDELLRWLEPLERGPETVFVTHGEEDASLQFAKDLHQARRWKTVVPELGQTFEI